MKNLRIAMRTQAEILTMVVEEIKKLTKFIEHNKKKLAFVTQRVQEWELKKEQLIATGGYLKNKAYNQHINGMSLTHHLENQKQIRLLNNSINKNIAKRDFLLNIENGNYDWKIHPEIFINGRWFVIDKKGVFNGRDKIVYIINRELSEVKVCEIEEHYAFWNEKTERLEKGLRHRNDYTNLNYNFIEDRFQCNGDGSLNLQIFNKKIKQHLKTTINSII